MYINSVLSFMGCWNNIVEKESEILGEVQAALSAIDHNSFLQENPGLLQKSRTITIRDFIRTYLEELKARGWKATPKVPFGSRRFATIDLVKKNIGVEFFIGKFPFLLNALLVTFPLMARSGILTKLIILVPMNSMSRRMSFGVQDFELIYEVLNEMGPLPLAIPFVIVGISGNEKTEIELHELTSEIDCFLLENLGLTLEQMIYVNEGESYEFKSSITDNKKFAKEVCAFANRKDGGTILIGIDKAGNILGLDYGEKLDELRNRISSIIRDNCLPCPEFEINAFPSPTNPSKALLVICIHETKDKPCMTSERVYIRIDSQAVPASSTQIRKLVMM